MEFISLKIKKQDDPDGLSYWERFEVPYEEGMTIAHALFRIGFLHPESSEGSEEKITAPVCEMSCLEGVCGACAMQINGKPRLACKTFADEFTGQIVLEPLPKFPVVRDLIVNRSKLSQAVQDLSAFASLEGVEDDPNALQRVKKNDSKNLSAFDGCVMCGICSVACPQVSERSAFQGAFVLAKLALLELHPWTSGQTAARINASAQKGGVADCAGAMSCECVCPAGLSLASASAVLGRITAFQTLASYFQKV